jgi:hypothetical protein
MQIGNGGSFMTWTGIRSRRDRFSYMDARNSGHFEVGTAMSRDCGRDVGLAEVVAFEQERLVGRFGEGVGEAVTEV